MVYFKNKAITVMTGTRTATKQSSMNYDDGIRMITGRPARSAAMPVLFLLRGYTLFRQIYTKKIQISAIWGACKPTF